MRFKKNKKPINTRRFLVEGMVDKFGTELRRDDQVKYDGEIYTLNSEAPDERDGKVEIQRNSPDRGNPGLESMDVLPAELEQA